MSNGQEGPVPSRIIDALDPTGLNADPAIEQTSKLIAYLRFASNELLVITTQVVNSEILIEDFKKQLRMFINIYKTYHNTRNYKATRKDGEYIDYLVTDFFDKIKLIDSFLEDYKILAGPNAQVFLGAIKSDTEKFQRQIRAGVFSDDANDLKEYLLAKLISLYIYRNNIITKDGVKFEELSSLINHLHDVLLYSITEEDTINGFLLSILTPTLIAFVKNKLLEYAKLSQSTADSHSLESSPQESLNVAIDLNSVRDWLAKLDVYTHTIEAVFIPAFKTPEELEKLHIKTVQDIKIEKIKKEMDDLFLELKEEIGRFSDIYLRVVLNRKLRSDFLLDIKNIREKLKKEMRLLSIYGKFSHIPELNLRNRKLDRLSQLYSQFNSRLPDFEHPDRMQSFYFSMIDHLINSTDDNKHKVELEQLKDILIEFRELSESAMNDLSKKISEDKLYKQTAHAMKVVYWIYLLLNQEPGMRLPVPHNRITRLAFQFVRMCNPYRSL